MVMMTHELKSPLDSIRSGLGMITGGYCGSIPAQSQTVLKEIETRTQQMSVLVLDVLKLSRVRLSDDDDTAPFLALTDIVKARLAVLSRKIADSHLTIPVNVPDLLIRGKAEYLEMLFDNLIGNAVTYSRPGGEVSMTGSRSALTGELTVTIADQGIGISSDELPHIFEEYYRTAQAAHHNPLSTGVGLAIVKHIAELFGIKIEVESAPDHGTAFALTFPASRVADRNAEPSVGPKPESGARPS